MSSLVWNDNTFDNNPPPYPTKLLDQSDISKMVQEAIQYLQQKHIEAFLQIYPEDEKDVTTLCTPVPSSEHVAEIVGKGGCKIRALRARTSTYIKTPVRGDVPIFVVTGHQSGVVRARQEILQAAQHFTNIRSQRRQVENNVSSKMQVPLRLVGLVVGPKGSTIKRIQQETNTIILTPAKDSNPIFEVSGTYEGVESAKLKIKEHILQRTGSTLDALLQQQIDQGFFQKDEITGLLERPRPRSTDCGNSLSTTSSTTSPHWIGNMDTTSFGLLDQIPHDYVNSLFPL